MPARCPDCGTDVDCPPPTWDGMVLFLASEIRRVTRPHPPVTPTLQLVFIERNFHMPDIAVYTVGLPAATPPDANTVSFVGTLTIDSVAAPDFVVANGDLVRIPVGSKYSFVTMGVNLNGDRGPASDPATGTAGPAVSTTPTKPTTPTLTFLRVEPAVVPTPTPTPGP